ncbi:TPA: type IV conjugative transfer system protein TraL [Legionella anisa]
MSNMNYQFLNHIEAPKRVLTLTMDELVVAGIGFMLLIISNQKVLVSLFGLGFLALLDSKKIGLRSLHESINTSSSSGKLVFHIFGSLAEFEKNLIRERTHAGLQAARARGRKGGRPKKISFDKEKLALQLYEGRLHSIQQICSLIGVSKPTLYKYLKKD